MRHMRKSPVRELHIDTSALVPEAEAEGVVAIERRGEPAAAKDRIFLSMKEGWDRMPLGSDSAKTSEEDRDR